MRKFALSYLATGLLTVSAVSSRGAEVVVTNVWSEAMRKDVPVALVLPSAHRADGACRLPVAYMLHGHGGNHLEYLEKTKRVREHVDRFGYIAVCPDGMVSSWWVDSPVDPAVRYETFVSKELVAWTDAHLPTLPDRNRRAIVGASMGGFGALSIASRHTDVFGAVFGIHPGVELRSCADNGWDIDRRLGPVGTCGRTWDEFSVLSRMKALRNGELEIFFTIGTSDEYFLPGNRALHEQLVADGVEHRYLEIRGKDRARSAHNFEFQAIGEDAIAPEVAKFFAKPVPPPVRAESAAAPQAVFGVLADVHLTQDPARLAMFERTLRCLDARKVDGVVIAGDMVQTGTVPDLMTFGEVWRKVFPGDRRSDGGHVEKLFVYGDHETENMYCPIYTNEWARQPGKMEEMRRLDIYSNDRALQWKRAFGEDYAPIRLKRVKGFDFVLGQFVIRDEPGLRWSEPSFIPGLEEFFATNAFDRTKPFFYVQHKLLKGTVGGAAIGGQDSGRTTAILAKHPNAVAFCGHKHRTFQDERSLWQGAFTAVEVPALIAPSTPAGHENGLCSCDSADPVPPLQMPSLSPWADGHQGLIMSVYADRIVFERREFQFGEAVAEPWVVPWPNDGSMSYGRRKARAGVPQFAAGASVSVRSVRGKDRKGTPTDQLEVSFPAARSAAGTPRPFDYEVRAVLTKADVTRIAASKRVFSPRFYLPETYDTNAVTCVFAKSEISSNRDSLVFEVRPLNAFGRAGEPIVSAPYLADRTAAANPW